MKKLIALLAAIGAALFFWRKKHKKEEPAWGTADTSSSWGETSGTETGDTAGTESGGTAGTGSSEGAES
jgi:hypothetical protein